MRKDAPHEQRPGWTLAGMVPLALGMLVIWQPRGTPAQNDVRASGSDRQQDAHGAAAGAQQGPDAIEGSASSDTLRLRPDGWVVIAYDLDKDGRYDAVETIWGFDLIQARSASSRRRQEPTTSKGPAASSGAAREAGFAGDEGSQDGERPPGALPAQFRVRGEVVELETIELREADEPSVVVTLETDEGRTAQVALGSRSEEEGRAITRGEHIEVLGTIGRLGQRALLIAERVSRPAESGASDEAPRRYAGTILSTRRVKYRSLEERHVQARVELRQGGTALVDLGPASKLAGVELSRGSGIAVLADRVRIDGSPALRAEELRVDGAWLDLDRQAERERLREAARRR